MFLVFAFVAAGGYAVLDMALLAFLEIAPASRVTEFVHSLVSLGELQALQDRIWFSIRAVLEGGWGVRSWSEGL